MGVNRKNKVHVAPTDEELSRIPRSLVVIIGKRSSNVLRLVSDVRKMLLPWTAKNLNTTTANTLKDFIAVCGVLNITHLFVVKQSQSNVLFRICNKKEQKGVTFTFCIYSYSLIEDIRRLFENSFAKSNEFSSPPLIVLSGFENKDGFVSAEALELLRKCFSTLFPVIDSKSAINIKTTKRIMAVVYTGEASVSIRQYSVRLSHKLKDLLNTDSAPQKTNKKVKLNAKEKIDKVENSNLDADALKNLCIEGLSTVEIGPRLDITLAQVQSGVFSGTNLWVHPNFDTDKIKVEAVDLDDEAISIENDNVNDLIAESGSSSLED